MIYRLVTVWRDDNQENAHVRSGKDFASVEDAEAYISKSIEDGVSRVTISGEPMPSGDRLAFVYVPTACIVGWYVWELTSVDSLIVPEGVVMR